MTPRVASLGVSSAPAFALRVVVVTALACGYGAVAEVAVVVTTPVLPARAPVGGVTTIVIVLELLRGTSVTIDGLEVALHPGVI